MSISEDQGSRNIPLSDQVRFQYEPHSIVLLFSLRDKRNEFACYFNVVAIGEIRGRLFGEVRNETKRTPVPEKNRAKGFLFDPPKFFQGLVQASQSDSRSVPSAVFLFAPVLLGFTFAVIARRYVRIGHVFTDRPQQGWWADIFRAIHSLYVGSRNEGE